MCPGKKCYTSKDKEKTQITAKEKIQLTCKGIRVKDISLLIRNIECRKAMEKGHQSSQEKFISTQISITNLITTKKNIIKMFFNMQGLRSLLKCTIS